MHRPRLRKFAPLLIASGLLSIGCNGDDGGGEGESETTGTTTTSSTTVTPTTTTMTTSTDTTSSSSTTTTTTTESSESTSTTGGVVDPLMWVINGEVDNDYSGNTVSNAGDVNGDGMDDMLVAAPLAAPNGANSGRTYVVFGKADMDAVELSDVAAGMGGFAINGQNAFDYSGFAASGAGDVDGDGLDDVIIGAYTASPGGRTYAGRSYVVFGKDTGDAVELSDVNAGMGGFAIDGQAAGSLSGRDVGAAGDVDGDTLADVVIGAPGVNAAGNGTYSGRSYVVFGKADGTKVELSVVAGLGTGGFAINGSAAYDYNGFAVGPAGDVDGDGMADVIVGSPGHPAGGATGRAYVVFGKTTPSQVDLNDVVAGTGGFAITGEAMGHLAGFAVDGGADVNGDMMPDVIVGAQGVDAQGVYTGRSYVVFGKGDTNEVLLADVAAGSGGGFAIDGEATNDYSGRSVAMAGDVNGDGLADVVVGSPGQNPNDLASGRAYIVYGIDAPDMVLLSDIASMMGGGFVIDGEAMANALGFAVGGGGDINGDGAGNVLVGAPGFDANGPLSGRTYVIRDPGG